MHCISSYLYRASKFRGPARRRDTPGDDMPGGDVPARRKACPVSASSHTAKSRLQYPLIPYRSVPQPFEHSALRFRSDQKTFDCRNHIDAIARLF